jgi:hypothetical protein
MGLNGHMYKQKHTTCKSDLCKWLQVRIIKSMHIVSFQNLSSIFNTPFHPVPGPLNYFVRVFLLSTTMQLVSMTAIRE